MAARHGCASLAVVAGVADAVSSVEQDDRRGLPPGSEHAASSGKRGGPVEKRGARPHPDTFRPSGTGPRRTFKRKARRHDSDLKVDIAVAAAVLVMFVLAGAQCGQALYEAGLLPDVSSALQRHSAQSIAKPARTSAPAAASPADARGDDPESAITPWSLYLLAGLVGLGLLGALVNDNALRAQSSQPRRARELNMRKRMT